MTKIDDMLDRLQKEQPAIDTPDELTERIMKSLPERRAHAHGGHTPRKAWLYTAICTAAASIVMLLMLYPISPDEGERQQPMVALHTEAHDEKETTPPAPKDRPAPQPVPDTGMPDKKERREVAAAGITRPRPGTRQKARRTGAGDGAHTPLVAKAAKKARRDIPDTLGNGIWKSKENVARAIKILADCEATIAREHQQVRNSIIEATFNVMPQPAGAILVTNEVGDREVANQETFTDI